MGQKEYKTIQVMRGIAAMMVVCFHVILRLPEHTGLRLALDGIAESEIYINLAAGVDIFFVISGFVMAISSESLIKKADGWKEFIGRRLIRIVPLYWLLTTIKIILIVLAGHATVTIVNGLASYFFLPSRDAVGEIKTIIPQGWTLSFEMLFYALYAAALAARIRPIRLLLPVFAVVGVVSLFRGDEWPAISFFLSMLPLEFVFGVVIGNYTLKGKKMDASVAVLLLLVGSIAILTLPFGVTLRVATWGIPAGLIVAALVSLEGRLSFPRWLLALGESSYAIYLTHGFLLAAMPFLLRKGAAGFLVAPAMLIGCAYTGLIVHRAIEKPMTEKLKKGPGKTLDTTQKSRQARRMRGG